MRLGDLEALQGVVKFPVRIKCATLGWNVLQQGLDEADLDEAILDAVSSSPDGGDETKRVITVTRKPISPGVGFLYGRSSRRQV